MSIFDPNYLFASLIWGSVGVGYFIFGKRQQSLPALLGGLLMVAASYFAPSVLVMSLVCLGSMAAVYLIGR